MVSRSSLPLDHILSALDLHARGRHLVNRADRLSVQHQARLGLSIDLLLGRRLLFLSLVITPLILDNVAENGSVEDAQDQEYPENIDHLQHCEKSERDGL